MAELFDSLNPYQGLEVITARSPEELVNTIKAIRTPVKIINIVSHNSRFVAFIMGDIRKPRKRKIKESNNG